MTLTSVSFALSFKRKQTRQKWIVAERLTIEEYKPEKVEENVNVIVRTQDSL